MAGPIFKEIAGRVLKYLGVPPDKEDAGAIVVSDTGRRLAAARPVKAE